MISRRLLMASGVASSLMPLVARAATSGITLSGTMEQGSLVVGRTMPGSKVSFDGTLVRVSPDGLFACGLDWNRTTPASVKADHADGTTETQAITPVIRQYDVQKVNGLPPNTVNPPPDVLDRIKQEHVRLAEARKTDSEHIWFADPFDWPAPGIMSGVFGSQRIDNGTPMAPHFGVDMANAEGTPIHAPNDAVVLISDDYYLEGGFTLLDHGHGVFTLYLHQSKRLVAPGDVVKRGAVIGHIGKSGRATGPHLHWAMNWFQVKLDPSRSTRTPAPPRA